MIAIIRRDRGASTLIYTTRSCGETRSLFFCQNRSEQNSLAVLVSGKRSELIQRLERVVQIEERTLRHEVA